MKHPFLITFLIILLLAASGFAYWYFFMQSGEIIVSPPIDTGPGGFSPLSTSTRPVVNPPVTQPTGTTTGSQPPTLTSKIVSLRLLSDSPVGGYAASSTGTTTRVRWVDRGRGNVYEASYTSPEILNLSNTVVPKIFKSVWNKNLTAFIGSIFEDNEITPSTVYAELIKQSTSTNGRATSTYESLAANLTPYELKGKNVPGNVISYVSSPDRTQVLIVLNENGNSVGYISSFNGQGTTKIFTTPLTQINVSWPSDGIIAITTKGVSSYSGYLYFVNMKTGVLKKILGPLPGLSTSVSHDGKNVIYSSVDDGRLVTSIYSISAGTTTDAMIRTLADKCAWGYFEKNIVYCGVPSQLPNASWPDDWYLGTVATSDRLWKVNASTGEIRQLSSLVDQSDRILNVMNVDLDPKDKFVFFVNKNDLSLWSYDLTKQSK